MSVPLRVTSVAVVLSLLALLVVVQTRTSSAQDAPTVTYTFPHLIERQYRTNEVQYGFDSTLAMAFTANLGGGVETGSATFDVFLYDQQGDRILKSASGNDVCNPCSVVLNGVNRSRRLVIDERIEARGGFPRQMVMMWAVVEVTGHGGYVQGFIVNSHTSGFDLDITALDPQFTHTAPAGAA